MEDLSDYRKVYSKQVLTESAIENCPIKQFKKWFIEVEKSKLVEETNAMNISTIGIDGFPKNRIVLLKNYSSDGFVFYTNYTSEKGHAITKNPNVCLSFFWEKAERQVIIKGCAEKVSDEISEKYFNSRPKGSQIGAIVSNQSSVIKSYQSLEEEVKKYENKTNLNKPKHWGGYLVKPVSIEFWQGRPSRLHDRIRYSLKDNNQWTIERLAP